MINRPTDFARTEDSFREATAVAQRQSAKLFELRAAMSMARLWRSGQAG
jgi:hypothetical protein